jgi:hypothetical protein
MAHGMIYMVGADGALTRMTPSAPASEAYMQALIARHPELITDGDGDLLLIQRELPIPDSEDSGGRWSLDHLFVTRDAVPVLVELKRAADPRARREVVAQMLDYAANSTSYWKAGRVAEAFASTAAEAGSDPDALLASFLGDRDPAAFWNNVDSNFSSGQIKLVFVADTISRELARIVEFLNDQMRADVRAVELRWFAGEGGVTTLSPRIIGETERTNAAKAASRSLPSLSRDGWIATHITPLGSELANVADAFVTMIEEEGGVAGVASTQGSIYAQFKDDEGRAFYPFYLSRASKGRIYLNLYLLLHRPAYRSEDARAALYDRLTEVVGPLSTRTLNGSPGFAIARLVDPDVFGGFRALLQEIVAEAAKTETDDSVSLPAPAVSP